MADHNVARPDANWDAMMHDLDLIHDLMGGTAQMRRAGLKWLPREQAEHWDAWQVRLNRSILYNGLGRTIQAMAGHALTGDLILEGAAPSIRAICDNLDGRGMSLRQLAMRFIQLLLRDGTAHVLVDRPPEGGQPYAVIIEAAQVLGRVFDGGQHRLKQVRIRETAVKTVDRFRQAHHPQIRVLEEGVYEIWQQDSRQFWEVSDEGTMGLDDIPLVTASVGAPMQGWVRPPLMDLAWLNLAHWQSASDQRHILHIARVPILFARAMGGYDRPLEIGPNRLIMADDPAADIKFVEHSGNDLSFGASYSGGMGMMDDGMMDGISYTIKANSFDNGEDSGNSIKADHIGVSLEMRDVTFTYGQANGEANANGVSAEISSKEFGVGFDVTDSFAVGVASSTSEDDVSKDQTDAISISTLYTIAPGLSAALAYNQYEVSKTDPALNNDGTEIFVSIQANF